jgi:cytochrome b561
VMYEDQWATGARLIHWLFSFLAVLLVYWSIWYTSQVKPMSRTRFTVACSLSLGAGLLVHWALDVLVGVP